MSPPEPPVVHTTLRDNPRSRPLRARAVGSASSSQKQPPKTTSNTSGSELPKFYDNTRSVSIDRVSGLFHYNFGTPPRAHRVRRPRRGIEPISSPRLLITKKSPIESPLFWRPKLLVPRMHYIQKTERYNPYLKHRIRMRTAQERKAVEEERQAYLRLKAIEEENKKTVADEKELEEYVGVLKERISIRRIEEEADIARALALCEKFGLSMDDDNEVDESVDMTVDLGENVRMDQAEDTSGDDSDEDNLGDSDEDPDGSDSYGDDGEDGGTDNAEDPGGEDSNGDTASENLDVRDLWEIEASYVQ